MFRLTRKVDPHDLLTSKLYTERNFYSDFTTDLSKAKSEVIIESPYMTTRRVDQLLPMFNKLCKRGVKITINTRHPKYHEELLRIQAWQALKPLKQAGVKVYFFNNMHHRKIAIIDERVLWEGSLNILSQSHSAEIMRRIESERLTKQMIGFLRLKRYYW